ncbi:ATP-dependent Clp protease proteolytic subunit [Noviherbaspirillum galbum]|uniref:ATP-dependent Clp protease proteolytic subunit n=1 Tax=Noviherbaspirillum galbum TaxID=2709383 RepID=A0A6B3SU69_9BURK|nr:ATP-dependent Clp protease proteolytic subunit [Noviherbaspirillum galbum]NEX62915.1 ATP-dependent Clp protease proteolytic subunit [Noviherbaspirillum galbum]
MIDLNEDNDNAPVQITDDRFIEQKIFDSRFVFVFGGINDKLAKDTARRLIALADQSDAPITMLVSSPGGHVESGDVIHDVVKFIGVPVNMIGSGWVASAGTHLFLAVPKERRFCLKNTRFLIHQPSGGMGGQASDIAIQAKEIIRMRERIARVIAEETGQPLEKVLKDIDRDYWMSPEEAIDYGLVSKIINSRKDIA